MEIDDMWDDDEDMSEFKTSSATTHDRDKVITAANKCFLECNGVTFPQVERFYAIAFDAGRQAEREECAKLCEAEAIDPHNVPAAIVARRCADAIRARSTNNGL